jgi:nicotinamidase-related amidase
MVVFTRESHAPDLSDLTSSKQRRYTNAGSPIGEPGKMGRFLVQGEKGVEIIDELEPLPHEIQLDKPAHSCFVNTQLDHKLRSQNITHLIITGVTTQCCVLATYRHASDLGYYCLLLDDCCATFNQR